MTRVPMAGSTADGLPARKFVDLITSGAGQKVLDYAGFATP